MAVTSSRVVGTEDRDVRAGRDASRLQARGHGAGVFVEAAPRHPLAVGSAGAGRSEEGDRSLRVGGTLETGKEAVHVGFDRVPGRSVTSAPPLDTSSALTRENARRYPESDNAAAGSRKNRERGHTRSAPDSRASLAASSSTWGPNATMRASGSARRSSPTARAEAREVDDHDVGVAALGRVARERDALDRGGDARPVHEVGRERDDPHAVGAGLGAGGGSSRGASIANSGQRFRLRAESLCINAIAPGSSSPGRTSITPSRCIAAISSRPTSVRTIVSVQSLNAPIPPVEMSACSAAKSGHILQPSRPRVAFLQRHLVVRAVLHPDLEHALDVHLLHVGLLQAVLRFEQLLEDGVVEGLRAQQADVEAEAPRDLAGLALLHRRGDDDWHDMPTSAMRSSAFSRSL